MSRQRLLDLSERWFRLLLRFYPPDFRDEVGASVVETYRDRVRVALGQRGVGALVGRLLRATLDAIRNGPAERSRPAASWRRGDAGMAAPRLMRSPALMIAMLATLTFGLGTFAIVYIAVQRVLFDPMPYRDADDLYFVWRDYAPTSISAGAGWEAQTSSTCRPPAVRSRLQPACAAIA